MSEGIDIYSAYQTVTDWNKVRAADIDWCYQKVSDGFTTRTPQSVSAGKSAGVAQGGYHFSQVGSPVDQANLLLSQCRKYGTLDLNPCLDLEDNPPTSGKPNIPDNEKADWAVFFGRTVFDSGNGFTLYANNSDWQLIQAKLMAALPSTFRWVARYGAAPTVIYDAWQYTSTGSCPGISASGLDRNRGKKPLNRIVDDMPTVDELLNAVVGNRPNGTPIKLKDAVVNPYLGLFYGGGDAGPQSGFAALNTLLKSVDGLETKLVSAVTTAVETALKDKELNVDSSALSASIVSNLKELTFKAV